MTIDKIHDRIQFIKNQEQGGFNTHEEIDLSLDMASLWLFNNYSSVYPSNQSAKEALAPFTKSLDYTTDSSGAYTVNSSLKFMKLLGMDVVVNDSSVPSGFNANRRWIVDFPGEDEFASRLNSQIHQPKSTAPVGEVTGVGSFKLYPTQAHSGTIRYLKRPDSPVYAYTQSGRVITYNSGGSTQLEWSDVYINKVISKALAILGVNLDNDKLVQYGLEFPNQDI